MKPRARQSRSQGRQRRPSDAAVRGLTLDTGALVAFERSDRSLVTRLKEALTAGRRITIPTVVLAEAWRGGQRSARIAPLIESCVVEPLVDSLARRAGETIARVPAATAIDAIVAASAAARGDVVLTSDVGDLTALASQLTGVDVLAI
jgi:predicted nucleic acid-binding protein